MGGRITKRSVDALKAVENSTETVLWDSELKGFGVRVQRGDAKSYVLRYRVGSGRRAPLRKLTIGKHGSPWTAETARAEAKRLLGLVAHGEDPAGAKAAAKSAPTVAELAARLLAEHAEAKRKPSTVREYRRLLEHVVLPVIGTRKAADIARRDIERLHQGRRITPTEANRALACLSTMFNVAERWGVRPDGSNPCRHLEKYPQRRRERFLSVEELARLGDALTTFDGSLYAVAAVKLLVFSGARLGEVLGLRWEWIDFERGDARLPDSKSGAKTLHLPPPVLAVLAELPRLDGNPRVVVGAKEGAALVNLEKAMAGDPRSRRARRCAAARSAARLRERRRCKRDGPADHRQDARPQPAGHDRALRPRCERPRQGGCCHRRRQDRRGDGRRRGRGQERRSYGGIAALGRLAQGYHTKAGAGAVGVEIVGLPWRCASWGTDRRSKNKR
jgi:integrase